MSPERDEHGRGGALPPGYVEQAVADLLAGRDASAGARASGIVPFRSCPGCGAGLDDVRSFVQEFWVATETRFLVWCHRCGGTYTVVPVERFVGTEARD